MTFRRVKTGDLIRDSSVPATIVHDDARPQGEIPEYRPKATPSIEVTISRHARETMLDDCFHLTRADRAECGGYLFARPSRGSDTRIDIVQATGTGNGRRTTHSLELDPAEWLRAERALEADGYDFPLAGIWHTHGGDTRDAQPSQADLRTWLAVLDWNHDHLRSGSLSVGLIYTACTALGDYWGSPRLNAYVTRRVGSTRRAICEPANVRSR